MAMRVPRHRYRDSNPGFRTEKVPETVLFRSGSVRGVGDKFGDKVSRLLFAHCRSALLRPKPGGFEALGTQHERVKRTLRLR
jgi:hypothetical protein